MSIDLGRRLVAAGLVPPEEVEAALFFAVVRGVPFARVLIDRGAITERGLEEELERLGGLGLRQVAGAPELVDRLPRAMCRRLAALPTRLDPHTGTVDVAAADPLDPHIAVEFGFHLGAPIRVVRAPIAAVEEAIRRLELDQPEPVAPPRQRRKTPPFPHGAPQSSNPPPSMEAEPIPLVRKAGPARETEPAPALPGRLPPVVMPAPFTMGAQGDASSIQHRATLRPGDGSPPTARAVEAPLGAERAPVAVEPSRAGVLPEPPAVSFPSVAPAWAEGHGTPPYGTPALAPPAPPIDLLAGRTRHETVRAPMPADDVGDPFAEAVAAAAEPRRVEAPGDPGPQPPPDDEPDDAPRPSPVVVRPIDGRPVLEALERAVDRDEVMRLAMRGMRLAARRIGVFAVKRGSFQGYRCSVELGDHDAFRELSVPSDQPSVLATAAATALYLGPIPATSAHEGLLAVMEEASNDVAVVVARVAGRPALVMLADGLDDTMLGTRFLSDLAKAVGEALARVLAGR